MAHINEFGEIIRDNDPNDRSQESITIWEGLMVFFFNYLFFIPGISLYFSHKNKGYTRKASQIGTIMLVQVIILFILFILAISS